MPQKANVTAIDALESFRARLLVYVTKARPTLEEVSADVLRLRSWLEGTQRTHWENEFRKRTRRLEEAQQALFAAKLSNLRKESAAEINAVHRARRELDEAVQKLRVIKQWARDFDSRIEPLVKQMEKMHTLLANDLIHAAAYLDQAVKTLDAYAGVGAPVAAPPVAPSPEPAVPSDPQAPDAAVPSEKGADK